MSPRLKKQKNRTRHGKKAVFASSKFHPLGGLGLLAIALFLIAQSLKREPKTPHNAHPSAASQGTKETPTSSPIPISTRAVTPASAEPDPEAALRPVEAADLNQSSEEALAALSEDHQTHDHYTSARLKGMEAIRAAGLEWPTRTFEASDSMLEHNLREREYAAFNLALVDPERAIQSLSAQIKFEEDKFVTRRWQTSLRELDAAEDSSLRANYLSEMLRAIPDRHFGIVLNENRETILSNSQLQEEALQESLAREDAATKFHALALLLNEKPPASSENITRAYAELSQLLGRPATLEKDLFFTVGELLSRSPDLSSK